MTFRVLTSAWDRAAGTVDSYVVTDVPKNYIGEPRWPPAAEFKVSVRYDDETQQRRALEYCDYLNKGIVIQPPIGT